MNGTVALDLEVITSKLDHLASTVARAHMAQSSEEAQLPKIFQNPDLQDHTRRLRISANAVLSNASTVIDAGSSQEGGSQYIPTTFSEFGVPLDNAKRSRIEEWTQNTVIGVEEYGSIGGRSDKGGHSSTSIDRSPTSNVSLASTKLENDTDLLIVKLCSRMPNDTGLKPTIWKPRNFFELG